MLLFLTCSQFSAIFFSPYAPQMALQQRDHLCDAVVLPEQAFEFDISGMKSHSTCSCNMQIILATAAGKFSADKKYSPESRIITFKNILSA